MQGGHDAAAHTVGESHRARPAAYGKPIALKRQRERVVPQEMERRVTQKP